MFDILKKSCKMVVLNNVRKFVLGLEEWYTHLPTHPNLLHFSDHCKSVLTNHRNLSHCIFQLHLLIFSLFFLYIYMYMNHIIEVNCKWLLLFYKTILFCLFIQFVFFHMLGFKTYGIQQRTEFYTRWWGGGSVLGWMKK